MRRTLYDSYLEQASYREVEKPVEDYHNPALFWCDCFHIYDASGNHVLDILGPDMTNEQFDTYRDYYEFKPCWTGNDYTHHHYLKP